MPIVRGKKLECDEWFVEHGNNKIYWKRNWKIDWSREADGKKWILYNLKEDPTEMNDLGTFYSEKLKNMIDRWYE